MKTRSFPGFRLGFRNKTAVERVSICRRVIMALQKMPAEHQEYLQVADLSEKLAAADEDLRLILLLRAQMRAALRRRDKNVGQLCKAVTVRAMGHAGSVSFDPAGLTAGGLPLAGRWQRLPPPSEPTHFRATHHSRTGAVALRWKRPARRGIFLIEMTTDPKGSKGWKHVLSSTREKCVVEKLNSGQIHWFRVATVTARGQSPYSQAIALRPG
jgi:hypothetical protein